VKIVERRLGNRDERNQNHGYETAPAGVGAVSVRSLVAADLLLVRMGPKNLVP
jgi:hypothetical protein